MNEKNKSIALFRLMVLGPLLSRGSLQKGELKKLTSELANQNYHIPDSRKTFLSKKTIERWYYAWLAGGFDALSPKKRSDAGHITLSKEVQEAILTLKKDNPARSLNTIIHLLSARGIIKKEDFSRSTLHRFLQSANLSKRTLADANTIERRSFVAQHAGDIWQGDVMHAMKINTENGLRKTYLVSLLDDASRLITHSAFCFSEQSVEIEGVLKQAILKRGRPKRLIIDNGAAYRSKTLQYICAQLDIKIIYCPAYEPQGKGKIEKWHRLFRETFMREINTEIIRGLDDLNARLWAWLEQYYHQKPHSGLENNLSPIERWRQDLMHVRPIQPFDKDFESYFYHRVQRKVKKDGTVSYDGKKYEVPFTLVNDNVFVLIEPHEMQVIYIESISGENLGEAHLLNAAANICRKRQRPSLINEKKQNDSNNLVEISYQDHLKKNLITEE